MYENLKDESLKEFTFHKSFATIVISVCFCLFLCSNVFSDHTFQDPISNAFQPAFMHPRDNLVWYTKPLGNKLGVLDPITGDFREFDVPTVNSEPHGLTSDLQGNIWFVEQAGNKLAKFDPITETFSEFIIPTNNSLPTDILIDGNGIIWIPEILGNKIARFDPITSNFTEFGVLHPSARPNAPFLDSKGRIWWVERGTSPHRVGYLDTQTDSVFAILLDPAIARGTSLPLPSGDFDKIVGTTFRSVITIWDPEIDTLIEVPFLTTGPDIHGHGIVVGPLGNVWFAEVGTNKIGMLDMNSMQVAEFEIPTPNSNTLDIEFDDDGILWFVETRPCKIGSFDPVTSEFQEFLVSPTKIPTLTEWGMIIFSVLLFGWMAWVIVRRRKAVAIGA